MSIKTDLTDASNAFFRAIDSDLVKTSELFAKCDIALRREPDDTFVQRFVVEQKMRQPKAGFGRGRTNQHLIRAKEIIVDQKVIQNIRGHEEREKDAALILKLVQDFRLRPRAHIGVIHRRQRTAVIGSVKKAAVGHLARAQHNMAGQREKAPDTFALFDFSAVAFDGMGKAPSRHLAPVFISGEITPIADLIAGHGIADVVSGQAEFVDFHQNFALFQLWNGARDGFDVAQIGAVGPKLGDCGHAKILILYQNPKSLTWEISPLVNSARE